MKYRDVRAGTAGTGVQVKQGKGDHEKWFCPCGQHIAVVTQGSKVSPGVVADTIRKLACFTEGVVAVTTYTVRAKRWSGGWELHIEGVGVTQVRTLAQADRQVRDYLETLLDLDVSDIEVVVVPELGGLEEQVRAAREHTLAAAAAQRAAAQEAREVARQLRAEGLSVTDTATVLGVSRGRVSQLAS